MLRRNKQKTLLILVAGFLVLLMRLLPHLPNFAAICAISIASGYYLKNGYKYLLPLLIVFISDIFIGFYALPVMIAVYSSYLIAAILGSLSYRFKLNKKRLIKQQSGAIILSTLAASVLFFLITNAAVVFAGTMYPHTINGLISSYINAIPFFRNSLASDLAFTGTIFLTVESLALLNNKLVARKKALLERN